jgi:hypothetical protein
MALLDWFLLKWPASKVSEHRNLIVCHETDRTRWTGQIEDDFFPSTVKTGRPDWANFRKIGRIWTDWANFRRLGEYLESGRIFADGANFRKLGEFSQIRRILRERENFRRLGEFSQMRRIFRERENFHPLGDCLFCSAFRFFQNQQKFLGNIFTVKVMH